MPVSRWRNQIPWLYYFQKRHAMDSEYIKIIVEWPVLKSQYDIQVFLSFVNFYRWFIKDCSHIVLLLTTLLRKSFKFWWKQEAQEAFDEIKEAFLTKSILRHFDLEFSTILHTYSFNAAISGIINQSHENRLHFVAFWSRKCLSIECNYDIYDREMLTIIEFVKHWCYYLEDIKFFIQIYSNHKNLEVFMTIKVFN